jgi:hypothetical protein
LRVEAARCHNVRLKGCRARYAIEEKGQGLMTGVARPAGPVQEVAVRTQQGASQVTAEVTNRCTLFPVRS